jgi:hypothetical protein
VVEGVDGRRLRYQHRREILLHAAVEVARDQLITEIIERVVTDALVPPKVDRTRGPEVWLRQLWAYWRSPEGRRFVKLFLSVVGHSLYDDVGSAALRGSIDHRRSRLAEALVEMGCPVDESSVLADYLTATLRGLLLELLVTDDGERVDAGLELLVRDLTARSAQW